MIIEKISNLAGRLIFTCEMKSLEHSQQGIKEQQSMKAKFTQTKSQPIWT